MCLVGSISLEKNGKRYEVNEEDRGHIARILEAIVRIWAFTLSQEPMEGLSRRMTQCNLHIKRFTPENQLKVDKSESRKEMNESWKRYDK